MALRKLGKAAAICVMQARKEDEFGQVTTISVVVPNKSEIPVGAISSIVKHAKLPRNLFE